jgi:hypothetical protein
MYIKLTDNRPKVADIKTKCYVITYDKYTYSEVCCYYSCSCKDCSLYYKFTNAK